MRWQMMARGLAIGAIAVASATVGANDRWQRVNGVSIPAITARASTRRSTRSRARTSVACIAWRRPHIDPTLVAGPTNLRLSNNFRSTPIMVNGVLYASNAVGLVEAFDPSTGKTLWLQKAGDDGLRRTSNRGVAYWGEGPEARIITFRNQRLYALDPKTGEPIASFGTGGSVNLNDGLGPLSRGYLWNSAPLVARDVIVMGSGMVDQDSATKVEGDPGNVRAFDVRAPASCAGPSTWSRRKAIPPSRPGRAMPGATRGLAMCGRA